MAKKDAVKTAEESVKEMLKLMGINAEVSAEVMEPEKGDVEKDYKYMKITVKGEELGALIGFRGRNMSSLQYIVGLILGQKLKEDGKYRVILDINDYREGRADRVREIAESYVTRMREEGLEELEMHPMRPEERRIIHMYVKEQKDVTSESLGEGRDRRVKLILKK